MSRSTAVFIDTGVSGWQSLADGVPADAHVALIAQDQDGMRVMARTLAEQGDVDAVHVLSHGKEGELHLGNAIIDRFSLERYSGELNTIRDCLAKGASLLLYGCNIAAQSAGKQFVEALSAATGAAVAASESLTGNRTAGGNWDLEFHSGKVAHLSDISPAMAASGFAGTLEPSDQNFDSVPLTSDYRMASFTAGDWTIEWGRNGSTLSGSVNSSLQIVDNSNATDLDNDGAGDRVLDMVGWFGETDAVLFTSTAGAFQLDSLRISLGSAASEVNLTIEGLDNGSVAASQGITVTDNSPSENPGQWVSFSSSGWQNLTAFRVKTTSGNEDISFFMDDLMVSAATVPNSAPSLASPGEDAVFTEDGSAVTVDGGFTVSDSDGDNITGATVSITSGFTAGDTLSVSDGSGITSSYNAGTGVLTLSGTTSAANYQTVLRTLTFFTNSQDPGSQTRTLTYSANDGTTDGTTTQGVNVTPVNDAPALGGLDGDALTFTEGESPALLDVDANATLSDMDSSDFDGGALTLAWQSGQQSEDRLVIDTGGEVSLSAGQTAGSTVSISGNAIGTLQTGQTGQADEGLAVSFNSVDATPANILTLIRALQYSNAAGDDPADGNRVVRLVVTDGDGGSSNTNDITINVDPVNDAPVVTASGGTTAFTEDDGATVIDSALTLDDPDDSTLASATVSITGNFQPTEDVLAFTNDNATTYGNIAASYNAATGVLTLSSSGATASVTQFQSALRAVTYNNTSQSPSELNRTVSITASDGTDTAVVSTKTVSVTSVNDAPVFSGLDGTPSFIEGGASVTLDADVTASDVELSALNSGNGDFAGASLTLARNGGASASDGFGFDTTGALFTVSGGNLQSGGQTFATFTDNGGTLTVSFTSSGTTATSALVNDVLQRIQYANASNDPAGSVDLDWTIADGDGGQDSGSTTVTITGVNDAPTLTATGGDPTYTEGGAGSDLYHTVTASTVEAADRFESMTLTVTNVSDGASEILRLDGSDVALTDGNSVTSATNGLGVTVSVTGSTATVSFSGASLSAAQLQTLVDGLAYRNTSDNPTTGSSRVVTITGLRDDGGTANGGQDASTPNLQSTVSLTAVNDPPVISGAFGEISQVTAGSGAANVTGLDDAGVSNADSADYNGGSLIIAQTTGTVNGNWGVDGTAVTSGGDGTVAAGETLAVGGVAIGVVDVTSDGQGGSSFEIFFNQADATNARVQTLLQSLTYSAPSGLGNRDFSLTLSDADGIANGGDQDADGSFTIEVAPNPPVLSGLDGDSVSAAHGTAVAIDGGSNAGITDADSSHFDGGNLTVARTSGLSGDFQFSGSVTAGGSAAISAGDTVAVGGTAIGSVTTDGQGSNSLVITFNTTDATPARVAQLVQALQFSSTDAGSHTFDLTVKDAGTGSATSAASSFTVNVDAPPVNTVPGTQDAVDDTALALTGISVADADSGSLTTTVSVTDGDGAFAAVAQGGVTLTGMGSHQLELSGSIADINATLATLQYTPAVNASGNQTVTVTTSDGSGSAGGPNADTDTFTISVQDRPDLSGLDGDSVTFTEGGAVAVLDSGADAALSDSDSADFNGGSLTVTVSAGESAGEDVITLDTSGSVSMTGTTAGSNVSVAGTVIGVLANNVAAGNDLVVNFSADATQARIATLLQSVGYTNVSDDPSTANRTLDVSVADGDGNTSVTSRVTVAVTAVNDAPTLAATGADPGYTEDQAAVALFGTATASTVESGQQLTGLTLTVTNVADGDDERLTVDGTELALTDGTSVTTDGNGLTASVSVSGTTATVNVTGASFSPAAMQGLITGLAYRNTSDAPDDTDRVVTLTGLTDDGGTANGGVDTVAVALASTVSLTRVNDAPTGDVTISGSAVQGSALRADTSKLVDADGLGTFSFQWFEAEPDGAGGFKAPVLIGGATGETYSPGADQLGAKITVEVSYTDQQGTAETVTSNPTAAVTAPPPPQGDEEYDGAIVDESTEQDEDGGTRNVVEVQPVAEDREEQFGDDDRADIPLVTSGEDTILQVGLPTGVGLRSEESIPGDGSGISGLIRAIRSRTSGDNQQDDQSEMTSDGNAFLQSLPAGGELTVRTLVPNVGQNVPSQGPGSIRISAHQDQGATPVALVIDTRELPAGTVIELENVRFAAVVGDARLVGGAGQQSVTGDGGAQFIVLGADDDELRGGGGDDTVGSRGGEDQLFGGSGDDHVVGGVGNDTLEGGTGNDVLQGGASDAGTWQFSLSGGELVSRFEAWESALAETTSFEHTGSWQTAGGALDSDARLAFSDRPVERLELVSTLYKAATGELPSLAEYNAFVTGEEGDLTLAQAAVDHFFDQQGVVPQALEVQVPLLIEAVWGEGAATDALVEEGVNFLNAGGTWAEAMLYLAEAPQADALLQGNGSDDELVLVRDHETGESGWSQDSGNDILRGGEGNDRLVGGDGEDWLDGGAGTDVAVYTGSPEDFTFRVTTGEDGRQLIEVTDTYSGDTDTLLDIELLEIGGQYYGPGPDLAGIEAGTDHAVSDFVVRLTGQAVEAMDLAG